MAKIFCLPLRLTAPSVHRELFLDFASGFFRQRFWADIKPGGCKKGQLQGRPSSQLWPIQSNCKVRIKRTWDTASSAKSITIDRDEAQARAEQGWQATQ